MRFDFDGDKDRGEWEKLTGRVGLTEAQAGHLLMLLTATGEAARLARSAQARNAANVRWQCRRNASASAGTTAGGRTSPNSDARQGMRAGVGYEDRRSSTNPAPPPPATEHYTSPGAKAETRKVSAFAPPADASASPGRVCVGISSLNSKDNTHTPGGGGGEPPRQQRLPWPPVPMDEMPARRVVDAYEAQVRPAYPGGMAVVRAVSWWLAHGRTEADLMRAVANYAADMDKLGKQARYRKSPATFFSRADPAFEGYLKEPAKPPPRVQKPAAPERPAPADQIRDFLARARVAVG